jgi:hypothetical protein
MAAEARADQLHTGWWYAQAPVIENLYRNTFDSGQRWAGRFIFQNFEWGTIAGGIDPSLFLPHKRTYWLGRR